MTLRIGIVGAGANTRARHIPGFQAIDGVQVVAVCNRSRESGERVAEEFGIPQVFDDWRALVRGEDIDAVCVGTWPYMHCPVTLEALAAGKHLLTEARMAMDLEQARQMRAASAASDRVAMVVPAPFYLEYEPRLLEMIAEGVFGELLEIHVNALAGGYDPSAPLHWRQRRDLSGLNIMTLGIFNETVRRYAGDESAVLAHGKIFVAQREDADGGRKREVDVPDSVAVIAEQQSGATAVYHVSSVARYGRGSSIEMHGTRGAFKLEGGSAWIALESDTVFRALEVPPEQRGGWRVEADFVDAIREGKPVTHTSFDDGVKYMQFTEAVQRSMEQGRRIALPLE